jgi:hypothetical protein
MNEKVKTKASLMAMIFSDKLAFRQRSVKVCNVCFERLLTWHALTEAQGASPDASVQCDVLFPSSEFE